MTKPMTMLRDYQIEISDKAAKALKYHKIAYLAMEVRTGKTMTALAAAYKFGATKVLFCTKKKAIDDIIEQAKKMGYDIEIYITNFEQLHKVEYGWDCVIIDEAHGCGAFPRPNKRARELKRICQHTPIIYLSGTPTPESFSQIYHQLWISSYSPYKNHKNFYQWARDYVVIGKKYIFNRQINDYTNAHEEQIQQDIKPIMFTFTQEQAGFEGLVEENILYVKMEESTYKLADRLRKDKMVTNKDGEVVMGDTAVKLMNKLHQIYSGSVIVDEPKRVAKAFDYTKAEFIRDKFAGKKIAIFYKFQAEYAALLWAFGSRIEIDAAAFNKAGNDAVFVSQIVSGREGLNLSSADALVFYNIDFSATSYWQSRARMQTKDRAETSQIYWIEDKIYKAVMNKKDYTLNHFKKDYLK
jgi:ATP-dependent protease HslVU (ClpYQ) peptidase subunit